MFRIYGDVGAWTSKQELRSEDLSVKTEGYSSYFVSRYIPVSLPLGFVSCSMTAYESTACFMTL